MFKALSLGVIVAAKKDIGCRDVKQWGTCLTAYIGKECLDGCDRTCGKCSTDICYDMIPQPHDIFWHNGLAVKSEWPNFGNNGNTLPSKTKDIVDDLFPFEASTVSQFCADVFKNHMCDMSDLVLTYTDGDSSHDIKLEGFGYEYCRFSCGRCLQTAGCYTTHNNAMQFLARDPDADTNFNNFNLENFWDSHQADDSAWDWDNSDEDETQEDNSESDVDERSDLLNDDAGFAEVEQTEWSWDSFDGWSWRKRREAGVAIPKAELLKAALENIVAGLTHHNPKFAHVAELVRKRRQTLNQMEDITAERQSYFDSINICWSANQANSEGYEAEEEEEVEEVEEEGSEEGGSSQYKVDQFVARRVETDYEGMKANFDSKVRVTNKVRDEIEMGNCEYRPMPVLSEHEVWGGMDLYYACAATCPAGQLPKADNPLRPIDEQQVSADVILMKCHRTSSMLNKKNPPPSICSISDRPGSSLICVPDPDWVVETTPSPVSEVETDVNADVAFADYLAEYYNYKFF